MAKLLLHIKVFVVVGKHRKNVEVREVMWGELDKAAYSSSERERKGEGTGTLCTEGGNTVLKGSLEEERTGCTSF